MRRRKRIRPALAALVAWLCGDAFVGGAPQPSGPPPGLAELGNPLPYEGSVRDPVFAIILALVESGTYGLLKGETIESELGRRRIPSRVPYRQVEAVAREALGQGTAARVTVWFRGPLATPIPYSILGYHPGRLEATRVCRFREWALGDMAMVSPPVPLGKVHMFVLEEGTINVDIVRWFDILLGEMLDDTALRGWALTMHGGRRVAVAFGDNAEGRGYAGGFDFNGDAILFPLPAELRTASRRLRQCSETLMKDADPALADASATAVRRCAAILAHDVKRGRPR